jgi:hypothetical protein
MNVKKDYLFNLKESVIEKIKEINHMIDAITKLNANVTVIERMINIYPTILPIILEQNIHTIWNLFSLFSFLYFDRTIMLIIVSPKLNKKRKGININERIAGKLFIISIYLSCPIDKRNKEPINPIKE